MTECGCYSLAEVSGKAEKYEIRHLLLLLEQKLGRE
jgi:hypothetical protein